MPSRTLRPNRRGMPHKLRTPPTGRGPEPLDQRLGAVHAGQAGLDVAQPQDNWLRSRPGPSACSASLSSLVSECHCRCKATSCCQVTRTSSGAASGRAPQTEAVVMAALDAGQQPRSGRGRRVRPASAVGVGAPAVMGGDVDQRALAAARRRRWRNSSAASSSRWSCSSQGWLSAACRISASRRGTAARWPRCTGLDASCRLTTT